MNNFKLKFRRGGLCFLTILSPKLNYMYRYWRTTGRRINLQQPKTFNEKIVWLELNRYHKNPTVIQCCDKYLVRKFVTEHGCGDTLIEQIGSWKDASQIPWDKLPNKFVLKWNFGAGFNIICSDKSRFDFEDAKRKLNHWKKEKYWLWYGEMHYKYVPKRIVCERYISDLAGSEKNAPDDYKFYCFHGKVRYILVCTNRKGMHADYMFFDTDWNLQPFSKYAIENREHIKLTCPKMLEKAIQYSERLSKDIPFVRVDWYIMQDRIYFGEMTFTPCGGMDDDLLEGDLIMSQFLELP